MYTYTQYIFYAAVPPPLPTVESHSLLSYRITSTSYSTARFSIAEEKDESRKGAARSRIEEDERTGKETLAKSNFKLSSP